jgi:hypothetical protein
MPFLSETHHRLRFTPQEGVDQRLDDVLTLLQTIVEMDIHKSTKKKMLNHCLWLVVELTGNFKCRYRSLGVLENLGVHINRDHVHPRKQLIEILLGNSPDYVKVVELAKCYCLVTKDEHSRLTSAPVDAIGWERYNHARVEYRDMLDSDWVPTE